MTRPHRIVAVVGTATEVGKTWTTCAVAGEAIRQGKQVAARKPVQSFDPDDPSPTDAELLAGVTGERQADICPTHRCYPLAMAPPMAADALGRPRIVLDDLVRELQWRPGATLGFLETVGGLRSPVAHDGDSLTLADRAGADLALLVADAELGTINATLLSLAALESIGRPVPVAVFLNRYDFGCDLHRRNLEWLEEHAPCPVLVDPADVAGWITAPTG